MRSTLLALLPLALLSTAPSTSAAQNSAVEAVASFALPTPVAVLWTVGRWLSNRSDEPRIYHVKTAVSAPDFESAKQQAFKNAIEHAVGSLVLNETEAHNFNVNRRVYNYSSGFIHNWAEVSRSATGSGITVEFEIWVSHSAIAERLLATSTTSNDVDGQQLWDRRQSYQQQTQNKAAVINNVLSDYPERSFVVKVTGTKQYTATHNTGTVLDVDLEISWDQRYINSLREVMERTRDDDSWKRSLPTVGMKVPGEFFVKFAAYRDPNIVRLYVSNLRHSRPHIMMIFKDSAGRKLWHQCNEMILDHQSRLMTFNRYSEVQIDGPGTDRYRIAVNTPVPAKLAMLNSIDVAIVRQNKC